MHSAEEHVVAGASMTRGPERAPDPLDAVALNGDCVRNDAGEEIGRIEGVMLDSSRDRILYAVLSLRGRDARLFPVPWSVLRLSAGETGVALDFPHQRLRAAPAFARDSWPSVSDHAWRHEVDTYYRTWSQRKGRQGKAPN